MNQNESNIDRYAKVLADQNNGIPCPDCKSSIGHYSVCPLLSYNYTPAYNLEDIYEREQAKVRMYSPEIKTFGYGTDDGSVIEINHTPFTPSEDDKIRLHAMGAMWDNGCPQCNEPWK
jgi:hypothetical protein